MSIITTTAPAVHARVKCDYCSQSKPEWTTQSWGGGMVICWECDLRRQKDLDDYILSGRSWPDHCVWCKVNLSSPPRAFCAVWMDNTHQQLCEACNNRYMRQRRDLHHAGTEIGASF